MDGTINAAAAVGGEGKDCCSNLVFTKKWDQDLKKNLCEEDLSKNLCEKDLNNGNQTPSTNSCFEQLQTLKATQFDSI